MLEILIKILRVETVCIVKSSRVNRFYSADTMAFNSLFIGLPFTLVNAL